MSCEMRAGGRYKLRHEKVQKVADWSRFGKILQNWEADFPDRFCKRLIISRL